MLVGNDAFPDGEACRNVLEHRASAAALGWLEARGLAQERVVLFTGSRPLARRGEEPFGLWRASRSASEGPALKEALVLLSRFGALSALLWRPDTPEEAAGFAPLAAEAAAAISASARVALLEEGRRERAKGVALEKLGRGLYRANGRYVVDAIFSLCDCEDFVRTNRKKRREATRPAVPSGARPFVRCKHLIAAENAEGRAGSLDGGAVRTDTGATPSPGARRDFPS